ncbi:hypothetical protein CDL15_Pgr014189 [Punica granatum]|uniref:Uncharacterized protein n=1 Tax=Punica granatum TaxID=22663 RepID=A0A218XDY8_PUNGR|nr:hypothetical protein CDL15_Pgr014189 [Punica granatum]
MNSNPGFDRGFSCGKPVGQNGVLTLGEGPAKISILECMCGPPRALFLDLSRAAFAQTSS